jgi:hypothetical protein
MPSQQQQDDEGAAAIELAELSSLSRLSLDSLRSRSATPTTTMEQDPERAPLIPAASSSSPSLTPTRHYGRDLNTSQASSYSRTNIPSFFHSQDEDSLFDFVMEKVRESKAAYYANKLAVKSEPGLTTAQLMLFNHDLKPVEPARRQWGPWNFVGFWVGTSKQPNQFHSSF